MNYFGFDQNRRDLLVELVRTSFKMRYQGSVLGFLWVLIKPYVMFGVMYAIFSNIIRSNVENYPVYLLTGVIFISFTTELLVLGQMSLLERANIILKVNFPRYIANISALIGAVINLLINLALILIIAQVTDIGFSFAGWLFVFLTVFTMFIWGVGISFFTSILTVRFRDLTNIIELGMFVMQYATPVFYSLDDNIIDGIVLKVVEWNPLTQMMLQFRAGVGVYGEINLAFMLGVLVIGILVTIVGYRYYDDRVKRIAEYF